MLMQSVLGLLLTASLALGACPEIVTRSEWGAAPPVDRENMTTPVPYVVIHHTELPAFCNTSKRCEAAMRSMQNYHQNTKHWWDIGYSFCVGGTGKVYEGRGWDIVGTHAPNYNARSTGICLIGSYSTELPTTEMLDAVKSLIECGVERGSISEEYKLLGHRQVRATTCPGDALYNEIKTWPHWDSSNGTTIT